MNEWKVGDTVTLTLPMPVRSNVCHPSVEANHNRLCFKKCIRPLREGVDNGGATQRFSSRNSRLPFVPSHTGRRQIRFLYPNACAIFTINNQERPSGRVLF